MANEKLRCLYAESISGKRVTLKVASVRNAPTPLYCNGTASQAWDILFEQKGKDGATLYIQIPHPNKDGKSTALLRQYMMATGSEPSDASVGKEVILYTVPSKKSVTGEAIRIAIPERHA